MKKLKELLELHENFEGCNYEHLQPKIKQVIMALDFPRNDTPVLLVDVIANAYVQALVVSGNEFSDAVEQYVDANYKGIGGDDRDELIEKISFDSCVIAERYFGNPYNK